MSAKILEVENIFKSFDDYTSNGQKVTKDILRNISFSLDKGESLGIIGLNGSGKSTLLKVISGIIKPSKGKITHFGKFSAILDLGFGMIPELTGRENIYLIGKSEGFSNKFIKSIEKEILEFSKLERAIDQPVKLYSNGMYLRLAFSIKIFLAYDLLIIDEIINVGDILFQEKCFNKIKELNQNGKSLILVSHSLDDIIKHTNTCMIIKDGEIFAIGDTNNIIFQYKKESREKSLRYNKSPKDFTGENNFNILISDIILNKDIIKMNEALDITYTLEVLKEGKYEIILFVSDHRGLLLSDSASYRMDFEAKIMKVGKIKQRCTVPANLFNQGKFRIGFIAADRERHYFEEYYLASFEVQVSDWEKDHVWNVEQEYYPFRPHLQWNNMAE